MSTTIVENWATDIAQLGPIYPFVGTEFILWIAGLAFWIYFHVWQLRSEAATLNEDSALVDTPEKLEKVIRSQRLG